MRKFIKPIFFGILTVSAAGCSYIGKLTGETDNTVLPGSREEAIPGKSQFPDEADTATVQQPGSQADTAAQSGADQAAAEDAAEKPPCKQDDPTCVESPDGTFSDPQ
jgi:hypothetical protein